MCKRILGVDVNMRFILIIAICFSIWPAWPAELQAKECTPNTFDGAFDGEITLCQNWTDDQKQAFWFTPQGSRIIPYDWFLALKQIDNNEFFADSKNLNNFRYLPQKPTAMNPDGLPIGFTKDTVSPDDPYQKISKQWLGFTCAACHTGQVEFKNHKILIDGAPALADFEGFVGGLTKALGDTLDDRNKFDDFAASILSKPENKKQNKKQLKKDLEFVFKARDDWNKLNKGDHAYGFARLDAIGAIFNAVGASAQNTSINRNIANAPVSYPFVWDTPQHDRVQWNGSIENKLPGAVARNVGEVLGVFGRLEYNPIDFDPSACLQEEKRWLSGFIAKISGFFLGSFDDTVCVGHRSSVNMAGLAKLETLLRELQSPVWPEQILGEPNKALVEKGKNIYLKKCHVCHDGRIKNSNLQKIRFSRSDKNRIIEAELISVSKVKTDSLMAQNFANRQYAVNKDTQGQFKTFVPRKMPIKATDRFGIKAFGSEMSSYAVTGVIVNKILNEPGPTIDALMVGESDIVKAFLENLKSKMISAKDRNNVVKIKLLVGALRKASKAKMPSQIENMGGDPNERLQDFVKRLREAVKKTQEIIKVDLTDQQKLDRNTNLMVYKARPLNGIWATAPYLHNGSVRTLRQLLLPEKCVNEIEVDPETGNRLCRQQSFHVGSREFDPVNLGFIDDGDFLLDTSKKGNRNTGHTYGHNRFKNNPEEIDALLEYLKTL